MTTLKSIRNLVKHGIAKDGNGRTFEELQALSLNKHTIDTSSGVYGINGALFQDTRTGELVAFVGRTSALFDVF